MTTRQQDHSPRQSETRGVLHPSGIISEHAAAILITRGGQQSGAVTRLGCCDGSWALKARTTLVVALGVGGISPCGLR